MLDLPPPRVPRDQENITRMVDTFLDYNITVGAVDLDSLWSTGVNNFVFDTSKYPNATEMVGMAPPTNGRWTREIKEERRRGGGGEWGIPEARKNERKRRMGGGLTAAIPVSMCTD